MGDNIPPCLTLFVTRKGFDIVVPHLTCIFLVCVHTKQCKNKVKNANKCSILFSSNTNKILAKQIKNAELKFLYTLLQTFWKHDSASIEWL